MFCAHVEGGAAAGILAGFGHPFSGWDHILAMVAVGLWGAQLGAPAVWALPVAFPLMMAVGGFLGLVGATLPLVEIGIAASAIALGALVALEARPRLEVAIAAVAVFAVFHGHAHGTELVAGTSPLAYSLGFVVATGSLHGLGIFLGLARTLRAGRPAIRFAGALVAGIGTVFFLRAVS